MSIGSECLLDKEIPVGLNEVILVKDSYNLGDYWWKHTV